MKILCRVYYTDLQTSQWDVTVGSQDLSTLLWLCDIPAVTPDACAYYPSGHISHEDELTMEERCSLSQT